MLIATKFCLLKFMGYKSFEKMPFGWENRHCAVLGTMDVTLLPVHFPFAFLYLLDITIWPKPQKRTLPMLESSSNHMKMASH